jgi:hypothetical protein
VRRSRSPQKLRAMYRRRPHGPHAVCWRCDSLDVEEGLRCRHCHSCDMVDACDPRVCAACVEARQRSEA